MSDFIRAPSPNEWVKFAQQLALFLRDSPVSIQSRFDRLIAEIDAGALQPTYVADVLGMLIRDSLMHTSKTLVIEEDHRRFMYEVVTSIDRIFGDLLRISKTTQIYASDLQEVWVACEPMLDLLPEPQGYLDTLARTLSGKTIQYKYFLSDKHYYTCLRKILKTRHFTDDGLKKLTFIEIPEPYNPPVALYIHKSRTIGFRGSQRPEMEQTSDGSFQLSRPIDPAWMTVLDNEALSRHYQKLSRHATTLEV